jgi:hypothetical protein
MKAIEEMKLSSNDRAQLALMLAQSTGAEPRNLDQMADLLLTERLLK